MQWGKQYTVGMQYAVGTQYIVGVSAKKVNLHSGLSKYWWWWGPLPLVQKGQTPYSGVLQYVIGVSAKRSTHTVYLANIGGGDCYPLGGV